MDKARMRKTRKVCVATIGRVRVGYADVYANDQNGQSGGTGCIPRPIVRPNISYLA
ncbi:hypothetical protein HPP92_026606 [Vanilla planifolia]|uniref:Uncharacterized protein n=1 Tax=Vanilla planifolia TaxID=51239 RepID=A0A835U943_VANPL|nr:hypothetical protein HPP92_026606 [Vanilla planifolia]